MDGAERRRKREEIALLQSDMKIMHHEIDEVKDRLGPLFEQRRNLNRSIGWVGSRMDTKDREESHSYALQNLQNYADLREVQAQIDRLTQRKNELYDQFNKAKEEYRKLRDELR